MARGRKRTAEYITFTCNLEGCSNTRTELLSQYNRFKKHYCSLKCNYADVKYHDRVMRDKCKGCKKETTEEDRYKTTSCAYASYCLDCRSLTRDSKVKQKEKSQKEFIDKFNKTKYSIHYKGDDIERV